MSKIKEIPEISIDELLSFEPCPDIGKLEGFHCFESPLVIGRICNCGTWECIFYHHPFAKFKAYNGAEVMIKLI